MDEKQKTNWQAKVRATGETVKRALIPSRLSQKQIIWAIRIGVTLAVVLLILVWATSIGVVSSDNAAVVGALLALIGVLITQVANTRLAQEARADQQAIENKRAQDREENRKRQQAMENERAQDSALQAYLDQISHSDTYSELRTAPVSGHKRALQRAKIQTLLPLLDEERKGILLLFLHGAKLIKKEEITPYEHTKEGKKERWKYPILRLTDIDFSRTKLNPDTKLTFDDLESITLRSATLSKVNLSGANLRNADLRDADLSGAALRTPNQKEDPEVIPGEKHNEVDKAVIPNKAGKPPEGLLETVLSGADLSEANLSKADLSSANLKGARVTDKQLAKCKSLKGATMPDGSKHD